MLKLFSSKFLFLVFVAGFCLLIPAVSQAGLIPCGGTGQPMCNLCYLIVGIQGLINYGLQIMIYVALVMLVIAGVVYIISSGNTGMMDTAKGLLKNVLIGFSIILLAWLIVTTTMWVIGAKTKLGIERANSWHEFTCKK